MRKKNFLENYLFICYLQICVRLLDIGDVWEVNQRALRVLDDKFYTSPPAQVSHGHVAYLFC